MAAAREDGDIRIKFESVEGKSAAVPISARTESLGHTTPTLAVDRRQFFRISGDAKRYIADERSRVSLELKPDTAADIVESEESKLLCDATLINKKTGARTETQLTFENMTGFTKAGTVDITLTAVWNEIAYYQVPAGLMLQLGHGNGGNCYAYIGDDT